MPPSKRYVARAVFHFLPSPPLLRTPIFPLLSSTRIRVGDMCFPSYTLSRVRARSFPSARLPAGVLTYYVVDLGEANRLLALHFPATGPGANFSVVAYDLEYTGSPYSTRDARVKIIPFAWNRAHFLRLLTIARDGVVIVLDLWALGRAYLLRT